MIDDVFHASSLAWRHGHLVPLLDPTLRQATWTGETARALDEMPDAVVKDLGTNWEQALPNKVRLLAPPTGDAAA